jgi:hypothetical protein
VIIVCFLDIGRIVAHHNVQTVKVINSSNINKTKNNLSPKESLNSDGQQFYQYQENKQLSLILVELLTFTA